jgi:hypothetical protein
VATWFVVLLVAVVVLGLVVFAVAALRTFGAVKRLNTAAAQTGTRFSDAMGLLVARRAGLRVLVAQRKRDIAERKAVNTDFAPAQVTSLKGRQERDLIG